MKPVKFGVCENLNDNEKKINNSLGPNKSYPGILANNGMASLFNFQNFIS